MKTYYFGTNLRSAGHYFFELSGNSMTSSDMWFRDIPFNPEDYPPKISKYESAQKGKTHYDVVKGWTIFAISGSPIDSRGGCKSVFFWNETIVMSDAIERIKALPIAMAIINQMPFNVEIFKPE